MNKKEATTSAILLGLVALSFSPLSGSNDLQHLDKETLLAIESTYNNPPKIDRLDKYVNEQYNVEDRISEDFMNSDDKLQMVIHQFAEEQTDLSQDFLLALDELAQEIGMKTPSKSRF